MHKKTTCKEVVYKKIGWAAYPSYQVPFRERRVPFLLVNFFIIIAESSYLSSSIKRPDLQ